MESSSPLAELLRSAREERAWTQRHLADAAGVSLKTVKRAEQGEPISKDSRLALSAALGLAEPPQIECDPEAALARIPPSRPRARKAGGPTWTDALNFWLTALSLPVGLLLACAAAPDDVIVAPIAIGAGFAALLAGVFSQFWEISDRARPVGWERWLGPANLLPAALEASAAGFLGLARTPAVELGVFATLLYIGVVLLARRRQRDRTKAAERAFQAETPGILAAAETALALEGREDRLIALAPLLARVQALADACEDPRRARPLQYLVEDVARGISHGRRLKDYLIVARVISKPDADQRLAEDAWTRLTELRKRLNVFACAC